jgi:hypothetical protein
MTKERAIEIMRDGCQGKRRPRVVLEVEIDAVITTAYGPEQEEVLIRVRGADSVVGLERLEEYRGPEK